MHHEAAMTMPGNCSAHSDHASEQRDRNTRFRVVAATAETAVEDDDPDGLPVSHAPGFAQVSPAAVKILVALWGGHITRQTTIEALEANSGLSENTVRRGLAELTLLGWLRCQAWRGQGIEWELRRPPDRLSHAAENYYRMLLNAAKQRLAEREARLDRTVARGEGETDAEDATPLARRAFVDRGRGARLNNLQ
jgi:hypothetical protein